MIDLWFVVSFLCYQPLGKCNPSEIKWNTIDNLAAVYTSKDGAADYLRELNKKGTSDWSSYIFHDGKFYDVEKPKPVEDVLVEVQPK